jgi:hypothetical protein
MKKNGVKNVVENYKNGVKTGMAHSDIFAKTATQPKPEKDEI